MCKRNAIAGNYSGTRLALLITFFGHPEIKDFQRRFAALYCA